MVTLLSRSIVFAVAYLATRVGVDAVLGIVGARAMDASQVLGQLPWLFASSLVTGLTLGVAMPQIQSPRRRHWLIWASVIFFNSVSVGIEGVFFAPAMAAGSIPAIVVEKLILAAVGGALLVRLFAPREDYALMKVDRTWVSWTWRFALSSFSYLVFYFIFGAVNYALVTKPYYETHAGGILVPAPGMVLVDESIRAPLIVLSIVPFLIGAQIPRRHLAVMAGLILFLIGGVVPLLERVNVLPIFLLLASGWEIFFQNFLTGVVAALLLATPKTNESPAPRATVQEPVTGLG